jgi:hypothetical protein
MTDDAQDVAETFDDDVTAGDDRGGDDQETYDPPDEPLVVDHRGDESQPDQVVETLAERVRREEPEVGRAERVRREEPAVGLAELDDASAVGALVGDAGELDEEPELVSRSARRTTGPDALVPAEEAAMHLTADPPMLPLGDGYLDGPDDGPDDAG